jgi:hypothetical protein
MYIYIYLNLCLWIYSDEDTSFYDEAQSKGFQDFRYCLVMHMGERNLADIITKVIYCWYVYICWYSCEGYGGYIFIYIYVYIFIIINQASPILLFRALVWFIVGLFGYICIFLYVDSFMPLAGLYFCIGLCILWHRLL